VRRGKKRVGDHRQHQRPRIAQDRQDRAGVGARTAGEKNVASGPRNQSTSSRPKKKRGRRIAEETKIAGQHVVAGRVTGAPPGKRRAGMPKEQRDDRAESAPGRSSFGRVLADQAGDRLVSACPKKAEVALQTAGPTHYNVLHIERLVGSRTGGCVVGDLLRCGLRAEQAHGPGPPGKEVETMPQR